MFFMGQLLLKLSIIEFKLVSSCEPGTWAEDVKKKVVSTILWELRGVKAVFIEGMKLN